MKILTSLKYAAKNPQVAIDAIMQQIKIKDQFKASNSIFVILIVSI